MEVVGGEGAGPYRLGDHVNDIIATMLQDHPRRKTDCRYDGDDRLQGDILIRREEEGLQLRFSALSQALQLIDVFDTSRLDALVVKGRRLAADACLGQVYDAAGPTFQATEDCELGLLLLSYQGIIFGFRQRAAHEGLSSDELIRMREEGPRCCRVMVFRGSHPRRRRSIGRGDAEAEPAEATASASTADGFSVAFGQRGSLRKGDHFQDVMAVLGTPEAIHQQRQAPARAHHNGSAIAAAPALGRFTSDGTENDSGGGGGGGGGGDSGQRASAYRASYHTRGVDVVLCGHRHTVQKVVMHTNLPGHPLFSIYRRCPFTLRAGGAGVTHTSKWSAVRGSLAQAPEPMMARSNAATNPFGHVHLLALPGCVVEVTQDDRIASVTLFGVKDTAAAPAERGR